MAGLPADVKNAVMVESVVVGTLSVCQCMPLQTVKPLHYDSMNSGEMCCAVGIYGACHFACDICVVVMVLEGDLT